MIPRSFRVKTSLINLPTGMSPNDTQALKIAERAIREMTGAESVDISFDEGADGQPQLDKYVVSTHFPRRAGKYVSLASVDSDVAETIGDLLEDLAGDRDPSDNLEKLEEQIGDGDKDDKEDKEDKKDDDKPEDKEDKPEPPKGPEEEGSQLAPDPSKPRMPFASKGNDSIKKARALQKRNKVTLKEAVISLRLSKGNQKKADVYLKRVKKIADEFGIEGADALEVVQTAENSDSFNEFYEEASESITDEHGQALSQDELKHLGALAKGLDPKRAVAPLGQKKR